MCTFDIYATACANAEGVSAPKQVEGVDLLPYLTGQNTTAPHQTLFWRQGGKTAIRHGNWKLLRMGGREQAHKAAPWQLYDLSKDLSETNDLAKTQPDQLNALIEIWSKLNNEMREPLF